MASDFNPIDEAKHIMRDEGGIIPFSGDRRIPVLVDYITALRSALELAVPYVEAADTGAGPCEILLHTIRHLLED